MNDTAPQLSSHIEWSLRWAALLTLVGAALLIAGLATRSDADGVDTQVVPLHNDRANAQDDCPVDGAAWHFVIAPNDGTYAFVSIALDLNGVLFTFEGSALIGNAGQGDNVFVAVPGGSAPEDLVAATSYAEITPSTDHHALKFVLSSVCTGGSKPTTTTTLATTTTQPASTTTTTLPGSSTTTTTQPASTTTTTLPGSSTTTSTQPASTTTTTLPGSSTTTSTQPASTTTTTIFEIGGPTTTVGTVATTTTSPSSTTSSTVPTSTTSSTTVPVTTATPTGSSSSRLLVLLGSVMLIVGLQLVLLSRRRGAESETSF